MHPINWSDGRKSDLGKDPIFNNAATDAGLNVEATILCMILLHILIVVSGSASDGKESFATLLSSTSRRFIPHIINCGPANSKQAFSVAIVRYNPSSQLRNE